MNIHNDNVRIKIIKVCAVLFVIFGILFLLGSLVTYYQITNKKLEVSSIVDVEALIPTAIFLLLYAVLICYGLFKLRKWALYLFAIPVIWYFFWGVFEYLIYFGYLGESVSLWYLLPRFFLGLMALYIYRERHLFKSALKN